MPPKFIKSLLKPSSRIGGPIDLGPKTGPGNMQQQLQDEIALREIRKSQESNFERTFASARFMARSEQIGEQATDAASTIAEVADGIIGDIAGVKGYASFKQGFNFVASPTDFVWDTLKRLTGMSSTTEITTVVGSNTLLGFYAAVTPYLGCIKSAAEGGYALYKACDDVRESFHALEAVTVVNMGAPQLALQSVSKLLDHRSNDNFATGSVKVAEGAIGAALTATGYGGIATSAVSIASKIATLAVIVRRRVVEYKEVKRGNIALARPASLSPAVFGECPLLGCYLLANSTHSDIVLSCLSRGFFTKNWMDEVERNMKTLHPLINKSKEFINDYVWELKGPGILTRASATDKRPWVERFWIKKFGAMNKGYRVISKGKAAVQKVQDVKEKVTGVTDYITAPITTLLKKDIELFVKSTKMGSQTA